MAIINYRDIFDDILNWEIGSFPSTRISRWRCTYDPERYELVPKKEFRQELIEQKEKELKLLDDKRKALEEDVKKLKSG